MPPNVAVAILTWNRLPALKTLLKSLDLCTHQYLGIFDDAGFKDRTAGWLLEYAERKPSELRDVPQSLARVGSINPTDSIYLGTQNIGVAGNSNRALRWFLESTDADYLCLCNDDIEAKNDFVWTYAQACQRLEVGHLCYCGSSNTEHHERQRINWGYSYHDAGRAFLGNYELKLLKNLTGAMICISRKAVERIGYFDTRFGKFGMEHCDYSSRLAMAGMQQVNGKPEPGIDIVQQDLVDQVAETSVTGPLRQRYDHTAALGVKTINYITDGLYRPYSLIHGQRCNGDIDGNGILVSALAGYTVPQWTGQKVEILSINKDGTGGTCTTPQFPQYSHPDD